MDDKNTTKKYTIWGYFQYFKNLLGYHIYIFLILNLLIGLLDGIGLTMFIPLLSIATNSETSNESLGQLQIIIDFFKYIGIEINITNMLLLMVGMFVFKGITNYLKSLYMTKVNLVIAKKIRFNLIDYLNQLSYEGFTKMSIGRIQNHIIGESGKLLGAMNSFLNLVQITIMLLIYVGLAAVSNWQFAIIVGLGGLLLDFVYKYFNRTIQDISRKQVNLGNDFNEILIQSIHNFKYLKATNYFKSYDNRLRDNMTLSDEYDFKSTKLGAIMGNAREPLIIAIIALVVFIQAKFSEGNISSIIVSLLLFYRALGYITNFQGVWSNFIISSIAIESIDNIILDFKKYQEPQKAALINKIDNIKVENLNITFGNTPILKSISLNIPAKTSIALVGESGAGKTTLANVICGLQIPHGGDVIVDGKSLYESNLNSYRSKIGYITQESVIFNDTLFNNVTFWDKKTPETIKKFYNVMEMVSLTDFVNNLENKEDSTLGNNGILVSGGQKQRISIARELYKDIELLIMDEATSALDTETEKHIKDNIDLLHGKFTILIIAHRLSTIKNVDTIYLLEKGEISGSGDYNSLVQSSERFKRMVELQEL
jgi:ABC transporter, ATP-binding/permease protein